MITIQQWRATIGVFGQSKVKTKAPSDLPEFDDCYDVTKKEPNKTAWVKNKKLSTVLLIYLAAGMVISLNPEGVTETLLVIGGVETNPGPTNAEVLGVLIKDSPSEPITRLLCKIRTDVDDKTNIKNILKTGKDSACVDDIKATCVYLSNSGENEFDDLLKDGLAESVISRLNQLFSECCSTCSKTYTIGRQETPEITCEKCGKGSCQECSAKYSKCFKEIGLNGVFWNCSTCTAVKKKTAEVDLEKLKKKSKV